MIVRPCLLQRTTRLPTTTTTTTFARHFHPTPTQRQQDDHYATLDLSPTASAAEVKKQFYALSKSHHPDLHPNDPSASQRFVQISEAYAVLGSPDKRARYDRDFLRTTQQSSSATTPSGSFSSASSRSPAGGRAPSGLSRRRTQFRGPPPSFYRSGGWGAQGEKRAENASKASHTWEAQGQAQSGPARAGGTGPGGFTEGFDNDVPHFDRRGHYQTHSGIEQRQHRARRKRDVRVEAGEAEAGGRSAILGFFVLSAVLFGTMGLPAAFGKLAKGSESGKQRQGQRQGE